MKIGRHTIRSGSEKKWHTREGSNSRPLDSQLTGLWSGLRRQLPTHAGHAHHNPLILLCLIHPSNPFQPTPPTYRTVYVAKKHDAVSKPGIITPGEMSARNIVDEVLRKGNGAADWLVARTQQLVATNQSVEQLWQRECLLDCNLWLLYSHYMR